VNALSRRLFGKPSSALSAEEAATVVAALPNPSSLLRDPQRLQHRRDALLVAAARVADDAD
jgi:membrane peptidoglycan carboxypeptidase